MIKLPEPTIESVIEELLRLRDEDCANLEQLRKGGGHKKYERKGKQIAEYYTGRQCAFSQAVMLLSEIK